jgi:amino acid transporter
MNLCNLHKRLFFKQYCSAVGCSASLVFSGARLVLEASRDGLLPYGHTFGYVNPSFQAPVNALVLQYVIVLVYLLATPGGVYQFIISFAAWPAYIFFACIGIGVFVLRKREPELTRPFKANSGNLFS